MTIIKIKHYLGGLVGIIASAIEGGYFTVYVHIYKVDEFGGTVLHTSLGAWDSEATAHEALYNWEKVACGRVEREETDPVVRCDSGVYARKSGAWGFTDGVDGAAIKHAWNLKQRATRGLTDELINRLDAHYDELCGTCREDLGDCECLDPEDDFDVFLMDNSGDLFKLKIR